MASNTLTQPPRAVHLRARQQPLASPLRLPIPERHHPRPSHHQRLPRMGQPLHHLQPLRGPLEPPRATSSTQVNEDPPPEPGVRATPAGTSYGVRFRVTSPRMERSQWRRRQNTALRRTGIDADSGDASARVIAAGTSTPAPIQVMALAMSRFVSIHISQLGRPGRRVRRSRVDGDTATDPAGKGHS